MEGVGNVGASGGAPDWFAVPDQRWHGRKSKLQQGAQFKVPPRQNTAPHNDPERQGSSASAYLCETQILETGLTRDSLETQPWQGFSEDAPMRRSRDSSVPIQQTPTVLGLADSPALSSRLPAGKRWRGSLGPSLFMTAVESIPPSNDSRREREAIGHHVRRCLRMTAEERARNDMPPRQSLSDGLADPDHVIRRALIDAACEDWSRGSSAATRRDAVSRLIDLGALPSVALRPSDPIGRVVAGSIRKAVGAHGFPALLQELPPGAVPDLVSRAKSPPASSAHGFRGLTAAGRRSIRDAAALLAEKPGCVGFGTITLTDREAESCTRDQLATFQTRWMEFAARALRAAGMSPLVVLVAEIHPNRRTMAGGPVLHWHYAYLGREDPWDDWAVPKERWHRVIRWAWSAAFGYPRPHTFGCRVEKCRKPPGRYLSKYLSKTRSDCERWRGTEWERCIPKQWWAWTGVLRGMVQSVRVRPPAAFLRWCYRWRHELALLGECSTGPICIGEDGPTVGQWFGWSSEEALDRAIEGWIGDELRTIDASDGGLDWREFGP